jgi:lipopolysaccharide/colanic/teichoic acid biosynthesis glycosyltransferase
MPESEFLRAVCLERKRAERSRKPFVLMLIEQSKTSERHNERFFDRTVSVVVASIRAIDIAGWNRDNRVFGVIFTEIGTLDKESALKALRTRVTKALESILGPDGPSRLSIAFHYFPDDRGDGNQGWPAIMPLYPDLMMRDEARTICRALKRAVDIVGSAIAILLLSPILLGISVAIKLSSPGPVIFRQRRIGQHGVPFTFLKFRSMHAANEPQHHRDFVTQFISGQTPSLATWTNDHVVYKIVQDPRVTRVGRLLRRTSLDEMPQLINVLKGEMSLVGPRPPVPYEMEVYQTWHRRRVLEAKPGITGLWQVNGRSRLCFDDMVRLDLKYATTWSLWLDIKILLQTPRAVLSGEGAH